MNLGELKDALTQVSRQDIPNDTLVMAINPDTHETAGMLLSVPNVYLEYHEDTQRHTVWIEVTDY